MSARTYDIVVLSSSPPPAEYLPPSSPPNATPTSPPRRVVMSASPTLAPSPLVSPRKKASDTSKLGSRKASIPPDAIRGFATVGSLVRSEHFAHQLDDNDTHIQHPKPCEPSIGVTEEVAVPQKKLRKQPIRSVEVEKSTKPKPKPRARKAKADKGDATQDSELRLPVPKVSPYFANETPEPAKEDVKGAEDAGPKLTKSGKPRKPRAKKEKVQEGATEPKPKRPRATKPKTAGKTAGKGQNGAGSGSAHAEDEHQAKATNAADETSKDTFIWELPESPKQNKRQPAKKGVPDPAADGLQLEEAVPRRLDWTPPKDTTSTSPFTDSVGKENKQLAVTEKSAQFSHMISNFAYAQPSAQTAPTITNPNVEVMAATKRRRVELVHGVGQDSNSRESSPEKGKAPKKKPRTITDIATERYLPRNQISDALDVTSNFFESRTTTKKIPLNDVTAPNANELPKKPTRKRSTSKSGSDVSGPKEKSKKASSKSNAKPKLMAEKLLSPGSALVRMNKQDILFGTSSQLALEESPTMVRQIQLAIKESEADAEVSPHEFLAPPPRWPRLCKTEGKRGLWNAGSRDDEGGLLDIAEDVYIPEFDRTQDFPLLMDGVNEDPVGDAPVVRGAKDGKSPSAILISSDPPTPQHVISQMPQAFPERKSHSQPDTVADSIFLDIDDLLSQPPPSNQNVKYQCPTNHDPPPSTQNFQLASPYSKASFLDSANTSPRKRRGRPPLPSPTLSADRAQAPTIIPAHSPPQLKKSVSAPFMTPSRGSGRFIDIEEILDSEDEALAILSPTPPRSRNLQDSEPLPLVSLSPSRPAGKTSKSGAMSDVAAVQIHKIPTTHLLWNDIKPIVCASITTHIRSLPPTNDPAHPSWHEKILMYDPIVLEDFTAYLNTKTGIRTFKKATQKQIKAWNKKTKLEGSHEIGVLEWEDKVLAVEKELECNQVRDWCESMSVCCIWGEGRGKGGARRGLY